MLSFWCGIIIAVGVGACAGRAPDPVAVAQQTDQFANCEMIMAEIRANNDRMADLAREEGLKVAQNVAAGVVGLVVWPVWFGMDFQDAAGKEGKALSQRNEYLGVLAQQRCNGNVKIQQVQVERGSRAN